MILQAKRGLYVSVQIHLDTTATAFARPQPAATAPVPACRIVKEAALCDADCNRLHQSYLFAKLRHTQMRFVVSKSQ